MLEKLINRAAEMNIEISRAQAEKFIAYHEMLTKANESMNLTRVSADEDEAIDRNFLDSIAPVALMRGAEKIVDVGTGAGFPGVPLAIMLPESEITLMDSLDKRVKFLADVCASLNLNAKAVHIRAEDAGKNADFREILDIAVSRAVASVNILAEFMLPLVKVGGRAIMYKGPQYAEEMTDGAGAIAMLGGGETKIHPMIIPNRDWNHCALETVKISNTDAKYPRRAGMPEKRPLR